MSSRLPAPKLDRLSLASTFGDDAPGYERARPGYPAALIELVGSLIPNRPAQIVEVGCGSGKATTDLTPFAARLTALDNSSDLIKIAAERVHDPDGRVQFVCTSFEDAELGAAEYDALISAQAFHWVDPAVGLIKTQKVLRAGGLIALFWNYGCLDRQSTLVKCRDVCLEVAPHFAQWADSSSDTFDEFADGWLETLRGQAELTQCKRRDFDWSVTWSTRVVLDWFTTHSWWRALSADDQNTLTVRLTSILSAAKDSHPMPFKSLLVHGTRK